METPQEWRARREESAKCKGEKQLVFADEEKWREFEERLTNDPANLALCVAHVHKTTNDRERACRLLALRAAADIHLQMEPRSLTERQKIRWNTYVSFLKIHREKCRRLKANPFYKSRSQQAAERERLVYICYCQRTGTPINWKSLCP